MNFTRVSQIPGITSLYRYQRYNEDWLRQTIIEKKIYFSAPRDFNDPWDCRPVYRTDNLHKAPIIDKLITWYRRISLKSGVSPAEIEIRAQQLRADQELRKAKVKTCSEGMDGEINRRYRVCCFARKANCELMWAHYGDRHSGICLEFRTRNSIFSGAIKVIYKRDYPSFDVTDSTDALRELQIKSDAWEYEREFRLIAQEQQFANQPFTLLTRDNFLSLEDAPAALSAVIMGCQVSAKNEASLHALITASAHPVALKRAVRSPSEYKLTIELAN